MESQNDKNPSDSHKRCVTMAEIESIDENKDDILGQSVKIPRDVKLSKQGLEFL